ncbi:MAG: hypothetical protein WBP58_10915 [Chitinophagaceae bacterium]
MKKYQFGFFLFCIACLLGCQKEFLRVDSDESTLIEKVKYKSATDSIISQFTFNSDGLLTKESFQIFDGTDVREGSITLTRDDSGRIIRSFFVDGFSQDAITNFQYSASKVKYGVWSFLIGGASVIDSVVYTHTDKVSRTASYITLPGSVAELDQYNEYKYDSRGNLVEIKNYLSSGTADFLFGTYTFEYDDMINPWYSNDDVLVDFDDRLYTSPNNVLKASYKYADPSENSVRVYTYQYNNEKKPIAGTMLEEGISYQMEFIYKK